MWLDRCSASSNAGAGGIGGAHVGHDGGDAGGGGGATGGSAAGGGGGASPMIGACSVFPADNPWNRDVSALPLHPRLGRLHRFDLGDCMLCELYRAFPRDGAWHADSGAVFDPKINDEHPLSFTWADAAGLPIFPGLVRYEQIGRAQRHSDNTFGKPSVP